MFQAVDNVLGNPQITVTQTSALWKEFLGTTASSPPLMRAGTRVRAYDGVYGMAEFVLAYGVASLAIGDVVRFGAGWATTRTVAATRGSLGVSMSANTDTAALSWFCIFGQVPGTVATHTVDTPSYLTATAGSVSSTDAAGGAIAGMSTTLAASGTVGTKTVNTSTAATNPWGSARMLVVPDTDGLYVGMAVTGTGIAGGSTIVAISQGGVMLGPVGTVPTNSQNVVLLSADMTATAAVTGTFAHPSTKATLMLNYPATAGVAD
jgi:hypothetical protein